MTKNSPYDHHKYLHNTTDPSSIVPQIIDLINPGNVIDVGCGLGTFLKIFKEHGIQEVLGIDGNWVNKEYLFENIEAKEFLELDLNDRISLDKKYDLVICLEVAEHLRPERAKSFVEDLVKLGEVILFSAAIPGQKGTNHLNEQWLDYWEIEFKKYNYVIHDILKELFWESTDIHWWYKQNMVLVVPENFTIKNIHKVSYNKLKNVIHPDLFISRTSKFDAIAYGKLRPRYYLKLFLKSLANRFIKK